jgi:hypothetical protein
MPPGKSGSAIDIAGIAVKSKTPALRRTGVPISVNLRSGRALQTLHDGAVDFDQRRDRRTFARHLFGIFVDP